MKKIMLMRLKVPPAINQFNMGIDKNQASQLLRLLKKYQPETRAEKKKRLMEMAEAKKEGKEVQSKKPVVIKYGLNHVTTLIENKAAKLVVIPHNVEPIEMVCWLPALCRKKDVPYCIIKGKERLGSGKQHEAKLGGGLKERLGSGKHHDAHHDVKEVTAPKDVAAASASSHSPSGNSASRPRIESITTARASAAATAMQQGGLALSKRGKSRAIHRRGSLDDMAIADMGSAEVVSVVDQRAARLEADQLRRKLRLAQQENEELLKRAAVAEQALRNQTEEEI